MGVANFGKLPYLRRLIVPTDRPPPLRALHDQMHTRVPNLPPRRRGSGNVLPCGNDRDDGSKGRRRDGADCAEPLEFRERWGRIGGLDLSGGETSDSSSSVSSPQASTSPKTNPTASASPPSAKSSASQNATSKKSSPPTSFPLNPAV